MNLPEIYKNKIDDEIKNSEYTYYGKNDDHRSSNVLDDLPVEALIETKNGSFRARIIGKTNNYIVTNTQQVIYMNDCISIKKV